jgi:hypothetical protein
MDTTTQGHDWEKLNQELQLLRRREADSRRREEDSDFFKQATRAIGTLESQRKDVTRIYGDRIKKLRALQSILVGRDSIGQMSIDGVDSVEISPELKALVYNPVGDLS